MNTIMFIQIIKHSYIVVSRKYTNFPTCFFSWDGEFVPGKINANLRSKINDVSKRDEHSSTLVPKYLHIEHMMVFKNKLSLQWEI